MGVDGGCTTGVQLVGGGGVRGIGSLTGWDFYEGNKSKLLRQGTLVLSLLLQKHVVAEKYNTVRSINIGTSTQF